MRRESGVELRERVEAIVGQGVVSLDEIPGAGGYTPALRRIATLADGSTAFVKAAVNELTAGWLAVEKRSYESLAGAAFLPRYVGCDDEVLVLEDLRGGRWPPPWCTGDLDRVLAMLDDVARHEPPADVDELALRRMWSHIADDPAPFLGLGLCTREWFDRSIDAVVGAEARCSLAGDALVHFDVRSDNLCLLDDRVVLIDWNGTARGRGDFDAHCLAQSVAVEGGPSPDEILPNADPALVANLTGYFAFSATQPPIPDAPRVRAIQLAQLRVCLPWMTRLLHL
jgi:hypothetical protein